MTVITPSLYRPICVKCNFVFTSNIPLDKHMKTQHNETEYMRICRITQTVKATVDKKSPSSEKSVKSFDCSECGLFLQNIEQLNEHNLRTHNTEKRFSCDKCEEIFSKKYMLVMHKISAHKEKRNQQSPKVFEMCDQCDICFDNQDDMIKHYNENHFIKTETENNVQIVKDIDNEYVINEYPEISEKTGNTWNKEEVHEYHGMRMKGGGEAYKEAYSALKNQLVKGRIFKDSQGRKLTILEVPMSKKPMEVEVITFSKKSNEKRGKAKIHMWEPSKKKPCTIMVSRHSGSQFVFVKTVMEKFIKPFMDSLITDPQERILSQYSI